MPIAKALGRREEWIREVTRRVTAMLYLTTLIVLLVVVDSIHALGSSAG
ncbi:MAG TPA: hypothetical protein VM452_18270 [Caulifigura sp.]|jgi:hypothetical protein|nr:hypothetical protein [Caulifigura sp.]